MNVILIGLVVIQDNTYKYSKPFILNTEDEKIFMAQIIRDVDFDIMVNKNEIIHIQIVKYPKSKSYYEANIEGTNHNFKILGSYDILCDKLNHDYIFQNRAHGDFHTILDNDFNLELFFSFTTYEKKYLLVTPMLTGNIGYLRLK
jgi:hypothetical protein